MVGIYNFVLTANFSCLSLATTSDNRIQELEAQIANLRLAQGMLQFIAVNLCTSLLFMCCNISNTSFVLQEHQAAHQAQHLHQVLFLIFQTYSLKLIFSIYIRLTLT
jgi:hypothetical protein